MANSQRKGVSMPGSKSLRLGVLGIALLVSLALVGVAYGLWSKTLKISGTVNTGSVDAVLSLTKIEEDEDTEAGTQEDDRDPDQTIEGKDVASCRAVLSDLRDELTITIDKGYPSFDCWVTFDVHSTGTIPVHITQPVIKNPTPARVTVAIEDCYDEGWQLHTSERAYCTLRIHIEQAAEQNTVYTFSAEVTARQYNE
jgi:hypothetical protein